MEQLLLEMVDLDRLLAQHAKRKACIFDLGLNCPFKKLPNTAALNDLLLHCSEHVRECVNIVSVSHTHTMYASI